MGVGSTKGCKQCNIKGGCTQGEVGIYICILRECDGMRAFLARYYILYHPFYTSPFTPTPYKPPKPLNTHSPPSPAPFEKRQSAAKICRHFVNTLLQSKVYREIERTYIEYLKSIQDNSIYSSTILTI